MKELNLPAFDFKIRNSEKSVQIFDNIRKKYVILTPEEWVRQHFLNYLIQFLGFPKTLIKVEFGIKYNQLGKRPDILVFNSSAKPLLLVECKSTDIQISEKVMEQISMYNKIIKAPYCVVTNGIQHVCWYHNFKSPEVSFLESIPNYNEIR